MPHTTLSGRVAALARRRPPDDPELVAAIITLRTENARQYLTELVAATPPLPAAVRAELAALLVPPTSGGAA